MKNFKRVISAVIALALSASTLVAVSASKFADVDNTNYAEAIEVLTALDIVHGYEEEGGLVFKPQGDITRAEAATMIVGALNMTADAQAAAGTSKFTDVNEKASWASGYVNVGVAQGFINGMDDTTFAPQENVTYAQMCVMLTLITGYGDYAKNYGGYPTGYTTMAASTGINKGVSVSADTPLKRGQVAQMLYNALTTPLLGIKSYSLQGNEYEPQDGSKGEFKTLLADKFDGYAISAKITGTPNSAGLDKGKVTFQLTKDAFMDEVMASAKETKNTTFPNAFADIDVEPFFLSEGTAIVTKDADDKWHLVYFKAAEVDSKEYTSAGLDTVTTSGTNTVFSFGSGKEVKIPTADLASGAAALYVNNNKITAPTLNADWEALIGAAQGDVKFTKDANGKYDGIFIDYYVIGEVSSARYDQNKGETTISFTPINNAGIFLTVAASKIVISDEEVEEGNVEVTVKRNGEAAKLSDIAEDDIIAVYTKDYTSATITNPKTITILATDATDTGALTAVSDDDYTFNGTVYAKTNGNTTVTSANVGSTFTAVLDPFGDIYGKRDEVSATNYALVVDYYDGEAKLLTKDGSIKTYEVESADQAALATAVKDADIQDRVISYKVKKGTTINTVAIVPATHTSTANDDYKQVAKKVGSILLSDDSYIIDATSDDVIKTITTGVRLRVETSKLSTFKSLTDKVKYEAYGWDRTNNVNAFVIVKKAGSTIGSDSRFAVGKSTIGTASVDGETAYTITALYDGAATELTIADGAKVYDYTTGTAPIASTAIAATTNLQGKAFYFTKDSDGLIDNIYIVFSGDAPAATLATVNNLKADLLVDGSNWTAILGTATEDVRLVYGLVSDISSGNITFVNDADMATPPVAGKKFIDMSDIYRFSLASDCAKYSYNVTSTSTKKADKIYEEGLTKSNFRLFEYVNDGSLVWKKTASDAADTSIAKAQTGDAWTDNANYAFAMIVNEQVVAIYEIVK